MSTLNQLYTKSSLCPTPGLIEGVQQSFKERLKIKVTTLVKKYPSIKDEAYSRVNLLEKGHRLVIRRDLTGPEKLKLSKNIEISDLFPELPNGQKIQQLWKNLQNIYEILWLPRNLD